MPGPSGARRLPSSVVVLVVVLMLVGQLVSAALRGPEQRVVVAPGQDVGEAAARHPGAVVELGEGHHAPFVLDVPATVRGRDGAVVGGGVRVVADGARLEGLQVVGGEGGVLVEADHVLLDRVVVRRAELHGIEVVDGSATIDDCRVSGLTSPWAQGVETATPSPGPAPSSPVAPSRGPGRASSPTSPGWRYSTTTSPARPCASPSLR